MLQRLAQAILQSPRVESELPAGLRVVPQVGHARDISETLGARQGGEGPEQTGDAWNRGAGIPVIRSANSNTSMSVWGIPAMMYVSPARPLSIARM